MSLSDKLDEQIALLRLEMQRQNVPSEALAKLTPKSLIERIKARRDGPSTSRRTKTAAEVRADVARGRSGEARPPREKRPQSTQAAAIRERVKRIRAVA
ncbi:hypothetical protein DW322_08855 [Rhodococcus rhodnii]|uniref:Uncharacterized protein n=2 Tax=Rhodococcus rhodnii TaxID=38312 RepID=R7WRH7_9NOCA|nr:hypothetical protein [Rhodococcus rhodnii]EOM77901.1 hypothetical protein Rrhod_0710 [Rhodococcus rhodnii LMG 5362]TXG90314.1 hypothetical protein DW322_08855 [Rhodococcus rhodnii]